MNRKRVRVVQAEDLLPPDDEDSHIAMPWELTPCLCGCHFAPNIACDLPSCWKGTVAKKEIDNVW